MKITLDLPDIEGYEYTGEYRLPLKGEEVAIGHMHTKVGCSDCSVSYFILKKKEPKYKTTTVDTGHELFEYVEAKALEDALSLVDETNLTAEGYILFNQLSALIK
jgi:hypothetical protein